MSDLTIALPAFGRSAFTTRFLRHAEDLPFKILGVTGDEPLPVVQWMEAVASLLGAVSTPYVMLCDNDDLPTIDMGRAMEFLDLNPDYVCASGRIQGFYKWPDPVDGPRSAVTPQYSPFDTPATYGQYSANERVLAGFANSWSYYGVYRTPVLQDIWSEAVRLGLRDLQVHEKFCAMRTLTLGKIHCDAGYTSLYRQHDTSVAAASYKRDEVVRMRDMEEVLAAMVGIDYYELRFRWARWYMARDAYLFNPRRKRLKAVFPRLAWLYQNRHRYLPRKELRL